MIELVYVPMVHNSRGGGSKSDFDRFQESAAKKLDSLLNAGYVKVSEVKVEAKIGDQLFLIMHKKTEEPTP